LRSVGSLGPILVEPNGNTLYMFLSDTTSMSTCNGSCAQNWPPLTTTGTPRGATGISESLLGTIKRQNGTLQVTYHGHPLYSFIADSAPGMANGENIDAFGAKWEVISAAGVAVVK
jgi:predicted lipoprotein with Yx(FWY)xxD motif